MVDFTRFWGKARPRGQAPFHPLWAHGLDVAAAGEALAAARPRAIEAIAGKLGWRSDQFLGLWLHLLALHDIGKFSPLFQMKVPELYPADAIARPDATALKVADPGHPAAGYRLLEEFLAGERPSASVPPLLRGWGWGESVSLLAPIIGHHGRPVGLPDDDWQRFFRPSASADAALAFWYAVAEILPPLELPPPPSQGLAAASWGIAGLTQLADWIGSHQDWFPYIGVADDLAGYWKSARAQAKAAIETAGLVPATPGIQRSFADLSGITHAPTDAQRWAATVELPGGPLLALIEDVTGGGKTEAALMLAHRLLTEGRASGIYFALPTMATANAMFERVAMIAARLYSEEGKASLSLAHGRAELHPRFRPAVSAFEGKGGTDEIAEEADSATVAPAWLMSETRKAMLADLGVGTIDQAILAVLPARYQAVRLAGLAGKVLIVDEAHSYDAYVGTELERLIAFHAAAGGSTIILSATLPQSVKARIVGSWRRAAGSAAVALQSVAYPAATLVGAGGVVEQPLVARADLRRTLTITRVPDPTVALDRIRAAAAAGACVAWVRNTVDDAVAGAAALRKHGIAADLFHARFAIGDRLDIEDRVLKRFGRTSEAPSRLGQVLVATQVIEQSLDLDFDLVVSDLAPIDLLLQRAGRLWRHTRRRRRIDGPEFVLVSPDPAGPVAANWAATVFPRIRFVYPDDALLWRTAREVIARRAFRVPEDVRAAIEAVYAESEDDVPEVLQRRRNDAAGKASADRGFALSTLLDLAAGYRDDGQAWQIEGKVQTRLALESRTIRLARVENGRLAPWCPNPDPRLAWALSEVTAYEYKLKGRHLPAPHFRALDETARTGPGWSRFDEATILLPLEQGEGGSWTGALVDDSGVVLTVRYRLEAGLQIA